jgi:hypothetical protein
MGKAGAVLMLMAVVGVSALAQTTTDSNFKLALPDHRGQLRWTVQNQSITFWQVPNLPALARRQQAAHPPNGVAPDTLFGLIPAP